MRENFTILKQRAALERPTLSVNPGLFRVPEQCFAANSELPQDTRNFLDTSGSAFDRLPAREGTKLHSLRKFKDF